MAGTTEDQHGDQVRQETQRLRRQAAVLSDMVAQTEEEVANTFEQIAKTRSSADAQRCVRMLTTPGGMPPRNVTAP